MTGVSQITFPCYPPPLPDTAARTKVQPLFLLAIFVSFLAVGAILEFAEPAWFSNMLRVKQAGASQAAFTLLVSFAASVMLHELGHVVPSLGFGFYVSRIALGPICVTRAHGPWKLQFSSSWFTGSVVAVPRDETAWRLQMLTVIAGGPLATLLTFICAVSLLNQLSPLAPAAPFLSLLAQLNLFLFVFGLVPNSANAAVRNDARLFVTLLRNGCDAEQIRLYHRVTQLQIAGVRPSEYPRDLITSVAAATGNLDLMLFSALTVFLWALDSGDIALADTWDRHANVMLQDRELRLSDTVLSESACFDILHRNASYAAAEKLKTIHVAKLSPWLRYRATAALQIAEGTYLSALVFGEARAALPPQGSYQEFESNILDQLEARSTAPDLHTFAAQAAA